MRAHWFCALAVMTASHATLAEEVVATTSQLPPASPGHGDGFAAPNGQLGAGLSLSREKGGRAYAELGFYSTGQSISFFGVTADSYVTSFSAIVGGGYKIRPNVELEAALPLAFVAYGVSYSGPGTPPDQSETGVAVGNLELGASYLRAKGPLRMKLGGALQYGPWTIDPSPNFNSALAAGYYARGGQDLGLWAPETLSLVTPSRVEYGDQLVATGDGSIGLHIPTDGGDVELTIQLDPGVGYYATDTLLVGARLPFVLVPTEDGSSRTFLAFEPYGRLDLGQAFVNARFTLNLDEPLGFSFDEGRVWSLHFGGGGVF